MESEKRYTVENVHGVAMIHDNKGDVHLMISRVADRLNALEAERDELKEFLEVETRTQAPKGGGDE